MRETVEEKARRLLAGGRLLVERVDEAGLRALCVGDTGTHELSRDGDGDIVCSCPATRRCAHLAAIALVVGAAVHIRAEPGEAEAGDDA